MAVLVTGASGGFGRSAAELLLRTVDADDVILTTRTPDRLADLAARGADVRYADFDDPATLGPAFAGAERMLLISTARVGSRVGQHRNAITAAVRAGVRGIAYTSIISAEKDGNPAVVTRDHRATELDLMTADVEWTILRDNQYADAMAQVAVPAALAAGVWRASAAAGRVGFVARQDAVACAVAVLTTGGHGGLAYDVTGGELLTFADVAALAADITGRPLPFEVVTDDDLFAMFDALGVPREASDDPAHTIPWCSTDMVTFEQAIREGYMAVVSDAVERLTGRPPTPLRSLLEAAAPTWPARAGSAASADENRV